MTAEATPLPSTSRSFRQRAGRGARRALFAVIVPAIATGALLRYFVPEVGSGLSGAVAALGHRHPLYFGVALFLVFSSLTHYWTRRPSGAERAVGSTESQAPAPELRPAREILSLVAIAVAAASAALAVRAFVRPYRVFGPSMLPTLEPDDLIGARMRSYADSHAPRRGDIVVFRSVAVPSISRGFDLPDFLVKRVVGLPGDRIEMQGDSALINGWPVPFCDAGEYLYVIPDTTGRALHGRLRVEFLDDRAYLTVHAFGPPFFGAYVVQPGEVFVLGDNRGNSVDSRAYHDGHGGGVPLEAIEAQAERFLIGTQRSGDADGERFLRPIDGPRVHVRLEGIQAQPFDDDIARCLAHRPTNTRPPPPTHAAP